MARLQTTQNKMHPTEILKTQLALVKHVYLIPCKVRLQII